MSTSTLTNLINRRPAGVFAKTSNSVLLDRDMQSQERRDRDSMLIRGIGTPLLMANRRRGEFRVGLRWIDSTSDTKVKPQKSHTQAKRHQTAMKKPSQTFHPTPVFSAMRSIRRIVPFNLVLVLSKLSFILSTKALESRISSPIAIVSCFSCETFDERMEVSASSFWDSRDSRTEVAYWPLIERDCQPSAHYSGQERRFLRRLSGRTLN